jgi:hypothetical protein
MPELTAQVHQFDRNPGRGESILHALFDPPETAVEAEVASEALAIASGVTESINAAPDPLAQRDAIRDANDSASILRS